MAHPIDPLQRETRANSDSRSLGELFTDLSRETTMLVRQEVELAKKEMSQKAAQVGKDVGFLLAGAAVAYAGFLAIIAAIIIIVAHAIPWWISALLVGVVVAAIGGYLVMRGMNELKKSNLAPTQTLDSLKEDARWTTDQMS